MRYRSTSDDDGSCRSPFPSTSTSPLSEKNGDVLLQWGHKKRSRISRTEIHAQPLHRVRRRPPTGLVMPPPLPKSSSFLGNGRNLEHRLIAGNGSLSSRNGVSHAVSRSAAGERTLPFSSSSKDVKANGSLLHVINGAIVSSPAQQQQPKRQGGVAKTTAPLAPDKTNVPVLQCPRIYLTLSRKEKEDDFLAMKGTKLPQRPKKRAKNIDKSLQYCYPGMWLADLTRSRYEVREKKSAKKQQQQKRRGLKGMESLDSDSY